MNQVYINVKDFGEYYVGKYLEERFKKEIISVDDLICYIEDLIMEAEQWKEKYEDLEEDLQDNYRPIPVHEQYEVYDSDFI